MIDTLDRGDESVALRVLILVIGGERRRRALLPFRVHAKNTLMKCISLKREMTVLQTER